VNAVSDILAVIGPVELTDYDITLTAENFLDEVQREVRSGVDRTTGEPKRILKVLTPILFERIASLDAAGKQELISRLAERFANKDMIAYLEDPVMQTYLQELAITGEVYQKLPADLNEYLAVVNANIGGGKSDAMMTQRITLRSQIDLEGKINNSLTISRTHNAKNTSASWYNTTNKNYLQVYTPRGSRATTARGFDTAPTIVAKDFTGYATHADLAIIEQSTEPLRTVGIDQTLAFDKTVFASWLNTKPGTTRTFEMQYTNPQKLAERGITDYTFIFEKQSGVNTSLSFTIDAPPEYKWKESNSPTFTYQSDSVPGRLALNLTLIPIR
jgi:hypothetical protein